MGQRTGIKFLKGNMSWQTIVQQNNLDISIINLQSLEGKSRLDAEYYRPSLLKANLLCKKNNYLPLGQLIDEITDYHANGSYEVLRDKVQMSDEPDYALMIRTIDLENENYNRDVKYVSKDAYDFLKKSQVFGGEIIINKIGSAGKPYLMPFLNRKVSLGMNQFLLKIKQSEIDNYYLYVFLISEIGESLISQKITGAVPLSIDKQSVRDITIPIPSASFQNKIHSLIEEYQNNKNLAKQKHSQAEQLLLTDLSLADYIPSDTNTSTRNLSDCLADDRFDAEYWQPKYDEMQERVANVAQSKLGQLVNHKKGIEVGSEAYQDEGKNFIRVSDFSTFGIEDVEKKISEELYVSLKKSYEPKKGEVLFTKDGTIGLSFALNEDIEGILSGAFLRLQPKTELNTNYLALVLNSPYCKAQIERMSGGAIIAHLKPESAMQISIPVLTKERQLELGEMVIKSLQMRKDATNLLEKAKRAVEIFVEQDEAQALAYLAV